MIFSVEKRRNFKGDIPEGRRKTIAVYKGEFDDARRFTIVLEGAVSG